MAIIKCKMCGGDLILSPDSAVAKCEYCESLQTVPSADNEKKLTLFARANRLRFACEFDKAAGVYEAIVADFPEESEAYWGLVLCKYGIEYVDDPGTGKKIPTCHRSSFDSVIDDTDYEQALENADVIARKVYRDEAKQIEEIRKGILEVSSKEAPYDIFICYKETDINGARTLDSVLAQDLYDALTEKGYSVFFSRIILEEKLGQEYEPYIFAALNSAKIMLAVGTDYEHYNAVWVKNEWSRFLHLIASGQKKTLIPCYKNIDAYDMPKEFARLQAQDLGKVGAIQDLLRGISKILQCEKPAPVASALNAQSRSSDRTKSMILRGNMALEDGNWEKADRFFEEALNYNPQSAAAYIGKLLVKLKIRRLKELANCGDSFDTDSNYLRALQFADEGFRVELERYSTAQKRSKDILRRKAVELVQNYANQQEMHNSKSARTLLRQKLENELKMYREQIRSFEIILSTSNITCLAAQEQELSTASIGLEQQIKLLDAQLTSYQSELAQLGLFDISKKKQLKERIAITQTTKAQLAAKYDKINTDLLEIKSKSSSLTYYMQQKECVTNFLCEKERELDALNAVSDSNFSDVVTVDEFVHQCVFLVREKLWDDIPSEVKNLAPKMISLMTPTDKFKYVSDSIQKITSSTGAMIDMYEDGEIIISSTVEDAVRSANSMIDVMCFGLEIGSLYCGKVSGTMPWGALVELAPGYVGLIHISKLAMRRVEHVEDELSVGDITWVKFIGYDTKGQIQLSRKDALASIST